MALALDRPVVAAPLVVAGEPERLVRRPLPRPSRRWLGGVDVEAGGVLASSPLGALGVVVAVDLQRGWTVFFTFFGFVSAFTVFCCCCWWCATTALSIILLEAQFHFGFFLRLS